MLNEADLEAGAAKAHYHTVLFDLFIAFALPQGHLVVGWIKPKSEQCRLRLLKKHYSICDAGKPACFFKRKFLPLREICRNCDNSIRDAGSCLTLSQFDFFLDEMADKVLSHVGSLIAFNRHPKHELIAPVKLFVLQWVYF